MAKTISQDKNTQQTIQVPPTGSNTPRLNFKKILFILGGILLIAIVFIGVFYVKNLNTVLKRIEKPADTSRSEYLRLDFDYQNGQLKLIKAADVTIHPNVQPSKPEDGYDITIVSNGQTTYQAFLHKTQDPMFAVIPAEGEDVIVRETKSGSQIMTLKLADLKKSAVQEKDTPTPKINIFTASWKMTVFDINNFIKKSTQKKEMKTVNSIPKEAESLVQGITEPKIIAVNSETVVWYYPETKEFVVIVLSDELEGAKQRTYDWFRAYGVTNQNSAKITFFQSKSQNQ